MKRKNRNEDGFTLVEMLAVMTILSLLVVVVAVNVIPTTDKARVQKARADIAVFEAALDQYKLDMFDYPDERDGLAALKALPSGAANADKYREGGYIKKVQNDPWGNPYIYQNPGDNAVYDIISYGADGQPGGEGMAADITNSDG